MPPTAAEKYAAQMYRLARGLALFDPSPGQYIEAGQRLRKPRVEIGDLGYIAPEGTFQLLFNVHRKAGDPLQIHGVPEDFEPLNRVDRLIDYREERITPQHLRSTTGVEVEFASNVSAPAVGGISTTFNFDYERGATLAYFDHHESLKAQNLVHYADYFERNFMNWLKFVRGEGIPVSLEQLFLVTGCERTRAWATLLVERRAGKGSLGLETQTIGPGLSVTASVSWKNTNGEQARCGPPSAELSIRSETDINMLEVSQAAPATYPANGLLASDQCIFLKGFRGRTGLLNIWKPYKATAGPHNLPRDESEPNPDSSVVCNAGVRQEPDEIGDGIETMSEVDAWRESQVLENDVLTSLEQVSGSSPSTDNDLLSFALGVVAERYSPACKNNLLLMHDDELVPFLPKPGDEEYDKWNASYEHARSYLAHRLKESPPSSLNETEIGWVQHIDGVFETRSSTSSMLENTSIDDRASQKGKSRVVVYDKPVRGEVPPLSRDTMIGQHPRPIDETHHLVIERSPSENGEATGLTIDDDDFTVVEDGQKARSDNRRAKSTPTKTFQCRGYGDCRMVFNRSEHLARHIRKHAGERPFVCHCGKQFSRLENLRQHAQTVHADKTEQNERMMSDLASLHASMTVANKASQQRDKRAAATASNDISRVKVDEEPLPQLYRPETTNGYETFSQWRQPSQADLDRPNRGPPSPFSPVHSTKSPPLYESSDDDHDASRQSSPLSLSTDSLSHSDSQLDSAQLATATAQAARADRSLADSPSWNSVIQMPAKFPIEPIYPGPQDNRHQQPQQHAREAPQSSSRAQFPSHPAFLAPRQPPPLYPSLLPQHHSYPQDIESSSQDIESYSQRVERQQRAALRELQQQKQAAQAAHAHAQPQAHHSVVQQQVHHRHYEDQAASNPVNQGAGHLLSPPPSGQNPIYPQAIYAQATDDQTSRVQPFSPSPPSPPYFRCPPSPPSLSSPRSFTPPSPPHFTSPSPPSPPSFTPLLSPTPSLPSRLYKPSPPFPPYLSSRPSGPSGPPPPFIPYTPSSLYPHYPPSLSPSPSLPSPSADL